MTTPGASSLKRGDVFEVEITGVDRKGRPSGVFAGDPVCLSGGTVGSLMRAVMQKRRRSVIMARSLETVRASKDAEVPPCGLFGVCGGCTWQDLRYARQLEEKRCEIERRLRSVGFEPAGILADVIGAEATVRYRNKMDFTFGARRYLVDGEEPQRPTDFALGLHVPGRHEKVLDLHECAIQFPEGDALLDSARVLAIANGLKPYDLRIQEGLLRHLVLRKGMATGEIMVNLVTSDASAPGLDAWFDQMAARHPEVTTFVQNVRSGVALVAMGETEIVRRGPGTIIERLKGLEFVISANSFFQTNTEAAGRLIDVIVELADLRGTETVFDLFCGGGAIGICLSPRAGRVLGIESVPSAVEDARRNISRNRLSNVEVLEGDVGQLLPMQKARSLVPDVLILDPPRAGLHPKTLSQVLATGAPRMIYVSCNVETAARDLARARIEAGYGLVRAVPVDMFPHSRHVECVFLLQRQGAPEPTSPESSS